MKINNSFLNLFTIQPNNKIGAQANKNFYSLNGANLAPLSKDTVSFSGAKKSEDSKTSSKKVEHSYRPTIKTSQMIYDESAYAHSQLRNILRHTFDMPVIDHDDISYEHKKRIAFEENQDKPVLMITSRRKSPHSISEKMSQKRIKSKVAAKNELNDLIGAKIVLTGNSPEEGDYALGKLTEAIKKGRLKIKEVKNHSQENQDLRYASKGKINKLIDTARKNGSPYCTYVDQPRDSGYLAIHLITNEIADGYRAEIQIIGHDVAKLKEIEDLCYKCHAGKNVPSKYKPIKAMFKQVHDNEKLTDDYLEYTKRAYAYERLKSIKRKKMFESFLTIPNDLNIPKELDFNNIAKIKSDIDNEEKRKNENK